MSDFFFSLQAAFLLPMINTLLSDPKDLIISAQCCEPHAVIILPTRELAIQIFTEARKFSHGSTVKTVVAYGGTAYYHQAKQVMVSFFVRVESVLSKMLQILTLYETSLNCVLIQ
jgi:superfamily II DNA/RNA helicase